MATVHPGATLTPHFRDFLPPWLMRQPWYRGSGTPSWSPIGYFRFEDPAGEVGIETHLVTDGSAVYQIPMTYRGAPLRAAQRGALITTAQHSVLGTRWIYDGETDPVWLAQLLGLIRANGVSDLSSKRGVGPAEARGRLLAPEGLIDEAVRVDLARVLIPGPPAIGSGVAGLVVGSWHPDGRSGVTATGCLAVASRRDG
jgi:hypothetical protein